MNIEGAGEGYEALPGQSDDYRLPDDELYESASITAPDGEEDGIETTAGSEASGLTELQVTEADTRQGIYSLLKPEAIDTAVLSGEARMAQVALRGEIMPPPGYIRDYAECEAAHQGARSDMLRATTDLLAVMGPDAQEPRCETNGSVLGKVSWHTGEYTMTNGRVVDLAFEVGVNFEEADLQDQPNPAEIYVNTHVIQHANQGMPRGPYRAFTYNMTGSVIFDGHASSSLVISGSETAVPPLEVIQEEVCAELSEEAYRKIAEPHTDSLMSLSQPTIDPIEVGLMFDLDMSHTPNSDLAYAFMSEEEEQFATFLAQPITDRQAAIEGIAGIFKPAASHILARLFRNGVDYTMHDVQEAGLYDKLYWVLERAATMPHAMERAADQAIAYGFADRFAHRLRTEQAKAQKIAALARDLSTLRRINDCAPALRRQEG